MKVVEKNFKCRYCENAYVKKYSLDLLQRATHEGDVIRATPIEFIGGGDEERRSHFKRVRNILSKRRPGRSEKGDKAKKSIPVYKIKTQPCKYASALCRTYTRTRKSCLKYIHKTQ